MSVEVAQKEASAILSKVKEVAKAGDVEDPNKPMPMTASELWCTGSSSTSEVHKPWVEVVDGNTTMSELWCANTAYSGEVQKHPETGKGVEEKFGGSPGHTMTGSDLWCAQRSSPVEVQNEAREVVQCNTTMSEVWCANAVFSGEVQSQGEAVEPTIGHSLRQPMTGSDLWCADSMTQVPDLKGAVGLANPSSTMSPRQPMTASEVWCTGAQVGFSQGVAGAQGRPQTLQIPKTQVKGRSFNSSPCKPMTASELWCSSAIEQVKEIEEDIEHANTGSMASERKPMTASEMWCK
jgi:hypothetical protein